MKTNTFFKFIFPKAIVMILCITITSCKWPWEAGDDDLSLPKCYVDKKDLSFDSKKGDVKELSINCSGEWKISNIPDWLTVDSKEGRGFSQIAFTTSKPNRNSCSNEGRVEVTFAEAPEATETIYVEQRGGAIADCEVTPNLIVTLSNGIAFDFNFDKNVARYYRGYIEASAAGIMSEDEIIEVLESEFSRHVPSEDEVADFGGLKEGTRYIIYTLGYDKDGNRGDLISTEVTTLNKKNNEPEARIGNMSRNGQYWYWTVTKSATCNSYYMMSTENYYVAVASDVLQAWWLEYAAKQGTISEYVNGTDWKQKVENGTMFAVWTRGMDSRGNPSGVISWNYITSSTTRSVLANDSINSQKNKPCGDHSGRKLTSDQYKLYKIM